VRKLLWLPCIALLLTLSLGSCGYHLVGHGDGSGGAIPADVTVISLVGNAESKLLSQLRQRLQSDRYAIIDASDIDDQTEHAMLHINIAALSFTPSAYGATGIATQYRMVFTGSLMLVKEGETIWQSGAISRQGDVFVAGGPTSIEASRERLLEDLHKQWLADAVGRIRAGF